MPPTDKELEDRMGLLLQGGVLIAGATMAVGAAFYLARHGGETPSYGHFHTLSPDLKSIRGVWRGALQLRSAYVIQLGVLIMIATPVLRVAFAILGFALERDWLYTGISALVLALLAYALMGTG